MSRKDKKMYDNYYDDEYYEDDYDDEYYDDGYDDEYEDDYPSKYSKRKKKKKDSFALKVLGWVFLCIVVISMMPLTFALIRFNILPVKYWIIYGVVCALLILVDALLLLKQSGVVKYFIGVLFSLIIATLFVLGFFYVEKSRETLLNIINGSEREILHEVVVVVLEDDPATSMNDILTEKFGIQTAIDAEDTMTTIKHINEKYQGSIDVVEYENNDQLADALFDGEVRAIILDKACLNMIEDSDPTFEERTRVLDNIEFTTIAKQDPSSEIKDITNTPFVIYLSGIDRYGAINTVSRSDVNIIMAVNPNTKKILLTTTPRDSFVLIPGISGDKRDKLTHAGNYGVDKSMETLEALYGIDINYYLRVNFTSVETFVDLVGGIDVEVPKAFTSRGKHLKFEKGMMHMDGVRALEFVRERYSFGDGDNQRARNQMTVIKVLFNKLISPAMLYKFDDLMNSVSGNFETNLSMDNMTELVRMQLDDGASWDIQTCEIANTGKSEYCYSYSKKKLYVAILDEDSVKEASKKMQDVLAGR